MITAPYGDNEAAVTPWRIRLQTVQLDSSYPTGGYAIAPDTVGMVEIIGAAVIGVPYASISDAGYVFDWDPITGKLVVFWASPAVSKPLAEVSDGTNLSAVSVVLAFIGI